MKISVNYGDGVITLPKKTAVLLDEMGVNELKVLVYLCGYLSSGETKMPQQSDACLSIGISPEEYERALAFLRGAGLVRVTGKGSKLKDSDEVTVKKPDQVSDKDGFIIEKKSENPSEHSVKVITNSLPSYSGPELDALVQSKPVLSDLKTESEALFSRPLRHAELNMLVTLYDYFGFDEAYILQLLSISKDRSSPMSYTFRLGADFYSRNIFSFDALLEELEKIEKKNSFEGKMRRLLGIDKRALTAKEKKFFSGWEGYDWQLIEYVYEQTVDATGDASLPYMNKIFVSYAEKGIKSVEAARNENRKFRENRQNDGSNGLNENDFFAVALEGAYSKSKDAKKGDDIK